MPVAHGVPVRIAHEGRSGYVGKVLYGIGRDVYAVARLTVNGRVFTGDACNCFDGGDDAAADDERARRYWRVERTE